MNRQWKLNIMQCRCQGNAVKMQSIMQCRCQGNAVKMQSEGYGKAVYDKAKAVLKQRRQ